MGLTDPIGFSGEPWPQYPAEIEAFIRVLIGERVRSFLEVGCRYGDTLHAVGCALPVGSQLVGVDWGRSFVHVPGRRKRREPSDYKRGLLQRCVSDLRARGQVADIIIGDSRDDATLEAVLSLASSFDAVFIDAGHSAEAVRSDWERYGRLGRIVAFHDVQHDGRRLTGPGELFSDLKRLYPSHLVSVDPQRRGIGVIWRC